VNEKRCYACGQVKPGSAFYRDRSRVDGLTGRCRDCDKAKGKADYAANPDRKRDRYLVNREEIRAREQATRDRAVAIYGGACVKCGSADWLELDHEGGGGEAHRRIESHRTLYRRIVREGRPVTDVRLRLLCYPCHRPDAVAVIDQLIRRLAYHVPRVGGLTDEQRVTLLGLFPR